MYVLSFTIDTSLISDYNTIYSHLSLISDLSTGRLTEIKKETSPMTTKLHPGMKEFNSIFKKCNHIYHEIALKLNLSDSGFDVLYALCSLGDGCLQKDICEITLLSKQTIHSSVKKLVKEGYLSLESGRGRDMHIYLTPAGKALTEEKLAPAIQIENLAFTSMTIEEQTEFLRLYRKYADGLRRHAGEIFMD